MQILITGQHINEGRKTSDLAAKCPIARGLQEHLNDSDPEVYVYGEVIYISFFSDEGNRLESTYYCSPYLQAKVQMFDTSNFMAPFTLTLDNNTRRAYIESEDGQTGFERLDQNPAHAAAFLNKAMLLQDGAHNDHELRKENINRYLTGCLIADTRFAEALNRDKSSKN